MSTAVSHHHFTNPIATAVAVAVVLGGAAVIGVGVSRDSDNPPAAPSAPAQVAPASPFRVGLGDFSRAQKGSQHRTTYRGGGHSTSAP
jgi:hypothetical protein